MNQKTFRIDGRISQDLEEWYEYLLSTYGTNVSKAELLTIASSLIQAKYLKDIATQGILVENPEY
jgi:hypothetical protein